MAIVGIVAVDRQNAIGRAGKMPWHYKSDLRFFREQTTGHACVMGYRTWLSLGEVPLPNRLNLVLSRQFHLTAQQSVIFLPHESKVLALQEHFRSDLFIIGGAEIYATFSQDIDKWIVTEIPITIQDADKFMPEDFLQNFSPYDTRQLEEDLRVTFYRRDGQETS